MAKSKPTTLLDLVKQLPPARGGQKSYYDRLTDGQRIEFDEAIAALKAMQVRPKLALVRAAMMEQFGIGIAERTLREYLNG